MGKEAQIIIRGAREHNLQDVDLELPRDSLVVFTGLSGSGKSSLAFDTIFKEGQRRFMESLSPYARQFLGQMEKPRVDHIEGLSPAISIDQKTINRNPRSTVGTVTEIYDHLRLLFARLGIPHCPKCGREVASQTPEQITHGLYLEAEEEMTGSGRDGGFTGSSQERANDQGSDPDAPQPPRGMILAPIVQDRKGEYRKELGELLRDGYLRARVDGEVRDLREEIALDRYVRHTIEVVLDRVIFDQESRSRVTDAVEKALAMTDGMVTALVGERYLKFATERACPDCRISIPEMEPRVFSFNSPHGACPDCDGLGQRAVFLPERIVPNGNLSLEEGAIVCLTREGKVPFSAVGISDIARVLKHYGGSSKQPWKSLPKAAREAAFHGSEDVEVEILWGPRRGSTKPFGGIIAALQTAWRYTHADFLEAYRHYSVCPSCEGKRLNKVALSVTFREQNIWTLATGSVEECRAFFTTLQPSRREMTIGREIFKEIIARLHFLSEVGLDYLNLNRSAATLSGGEAQRIRLASQVGSGLQGVLYVLDEPSIGLHPRDNRRLLNTLEHLRDIGNTVLVVEHDRETMEAADFLVDIGPGAGRNGGKITAKGSVARVRRTNSLTGRYLKGLDYIEIPKERRKGTGDCLLVRGAAHNNLKQIDVRFPLGTFIAVTGVSGSGKSTLVVDIVHRALAAALHRAENEPGAHQGIEGIEHLDKVIEIDQAPIGRTPRSNPATYTKVFDEIRGLFANLPESKLRGYGKGRFSFNVHGGRCEACSGAGVKEIEMQFLANVRIPCEVCGGKRFNHETLTLRYKGRTVSEVLEMTVSESLDFFGKVPRVRRTLGTMEEVGLGYVTLGQPSTTLSGGEAQRVKLATELRRPATGRTLYILDEPTTGLHMADIKNLLHALNRLVEAGNTVVVIEHNLDVIKVADHVIDLGPEGGAGGGRLVAEGTPEEVARARGSYTAHFLRELFEVEGTLEQLRKVGASAADLAAVRAEGESQAASNGRNGKGKASPTTSLSPQLLLPDGLMLDGIESPRSSKRGRPRPRDLTVKGAHKNNLKHVDAVVPKNKLTVITGVSGSGKTSLAFDTLFAEGQRRYVESLSTYARRFLGRLDKAPVDSIEGIAPSISVDQKAAPRNPRSTVATSTEINDYFRLLFARVGQPHCPGCGEPLLGYSPESAAAAVLEGFDGTRGEILAELVDPDVAPASDKRTAEEEEEEGPTRKLKSKPLLSQGFLRVRVDDEEVRLDMPDSPAILEGHRVELVLDRVAVNADSLARLDEAFEAAFNHGEGIGVFRAEDGTRAGFSTIPGCLKCGFFLREELSPQMFSFNSHVGACKRCDGLGSTEAINPDKLIVDPNRPLLSGALHPLASRLLEKRGGRYTAMCDVVAHEEGFNIHREWASLKPAAKRILFNGSGEKFYEFTRNRVAYGRRKLASSAIKLKWRGLVPIFEGWYAEARESQAKLRDEMRALMHDVPCPRCKGARLKKLPLGVRVGGLNIAEVSRKTVTEASRFFRQVEFPEGQAKIADQILAEIVSRLGFLRDVGLEYLTLDRASATLSGGEAQRIRLAGQLGSHLMGVLYVLDEPTIGLHPRDTDRLLSTLLGLRDRGNTVVVVEHDASTMLRADYLIDMGPGAGEHGGHIVMAGTPARLKRSRASLTGAYLSGRRSIPIPEARRPGKEGVLVKGASSHNLKNIDVHFPLEAFICVTGVSGSGKSSLVMDILAKGLARYLGTESAIPGPHKGLKIHPAIQRVGVIDQSPIGRSPKSNPASYVGVMDPIRSLFASTNEAKARGYAKGRFSFNLPEGRCASCEGRGAIKFEMHFLSDVWITCDRCKGKRYNQPTLEVTFKGKSIADVLQMEISDALEFFSNQPKIHRMLKPLEQVGLGYMQVGQPSNTMSGGEAQRVKLAAALMERAKTGFYILDEPTTGLHFHDVERLILVLQRLVDKGNTVVVIEHNPDVMKVADQIIDLGPEGGEKGGMLIAEGSPEEVAKNADSHTGQFLAELFSKARGRRVGTPGSYAEMVSAGWEEGDSLVETDAESEALDEPDDEADELDREDREFKIDLDNLDFPPLEL